MSGSWREYLSQVPTDFVVAEMERRRLIEPETPVSNSLEKTVGAERFIQFLKPAEVEIGKQRQKWLTELGMLQARVDEMRRLGVQRWGDIELDPHWETNKRIRNLPHGG